MHLFKRIARFLNKLLRGQQNIAIDDRVSGSYIINIKVVYLLMNLVYHKKS
jgi:hypothetical protein